MNFYFESSTSRNFGFNIIQLFIDSANLSIVCNFSDTTAQEVIKALLQKFKITDNPRKFALYEKVANEGEKGEP